MMNKKKNKKNDEQEDPHNIATQGYDTHRISLASIDDISQPQTLKHKGKIKNDNIRVLKIHEAPTTSLT